MRCAARGTHLKQRSMIHELKKQVFRSILLVACGVLFAILVAWNCVNAARIYQQADVMLEDAERLLLSKREKKEMRQRPEPGGDRFDLLQSISSGDLVILEIDESGTITAATDPETAGDFEELAAFTLEKGAERGTKSGWRYFLKEQYSRYYLVLLNTLPLRQEVTESVVLSLVGFLAASALFAFVASVLTKRIVTPVEEAVTAQKRFIADASHELKTPLTVIDANAEVLEKSMGRNKWLDYIKEQTSRMASLVTELLVLSRLDEAEGTGGEMQREAFDAAEALMESALPFESAAYEQNLSLRTEVPDTLPVTGNRDDFRQIVAILTDNAIKHAKQGGEIVLTLCTSAIKRTRKEEAAVELRVSNTGETIPPEALPHLFERFYKADASRMHTGDSFGLGLAILKAIVEKYKGTVSVTSEQGKTEFTVCLPCT